MTENRKIVFAPQLRIKELKTPWVDLVLKAVGYPAAWVTDKSVVGDFFIMLDEDERLKVMIEISDNLGFTVSPTDYIADLAQKLKDQSHVPKKAK